MMRPLHLRDRAGMLWGAVAEDRGVQIVEFALSLPLLMLFVVGIFDFSGAITLKQKLTDAARDGARVAAADPASDLGSPSTAVPASVSDAYQVVDNDLLSAKVKDCGMAGTTPTASPTLTWKSPALTGCAGGTGMVVTIQRGCLTPVAGTDLVNTCVTIKYPYQWQFTGVSGLLGGSFIPPSTITTTATSFNEN
ncbi:MAG: TadE/TadG family type IV pilus assembly protein [Candidatus Sulfotelmatobacter sp.]|jgi:Flp pilus assembly protein TadG